MNFSFSGFFYKLLIDPVLSSLHNSVIENINNADRVIDVACGTGSLAIAIASKASDVTGIDLSEDMISTARRWALKKGKNNVHFELRDAADLSVYKEHEFDIAVTSMSIHQFEADLAAGILVEMKRIASKVIIIDYNFPISKSFPRSLVYGIEHFAGGDHYRNFRKYMEKEGLRCFTQASGIKIRTEMVRGNGIFLIIVGY